MHLISNIYIVNNIFFIIEGLVIEIFNNSFFYPLFLRGYG